MVETSRRREIEAAASTLFREHGYSGTSVRDIARALDIQGASLYAHVTSKQEVLGSIVERMASRFEAVADEALADTELGADQRLTNLVRAHIGVITDDIEQASVFVHEWRALSPEKRRAIGRRRDAYEARFRDLIAEGMAADVFAPVDPALTAAWLLTALNGLVTWYHPDGRVRPATLADAYADLALRAVEHRPEPVA